MYQTTIGFIGLGHMGTPMCLNLLKAGFRVKVFDVVRSVLENVLASGAIATDNIAALSADSDIIITMLQTGEQVSNTCLQDNGIFSTLKNDSLYIDSSSIDIATTRKLHAIAREKNIAMLDAPVSGGVQGAKNASLTFMVGGEENNFRKSLPILEKMGKKIIYAGVGGSGQAAKICNNLILGISMIAVSEGFILSEKLGLDPKKFFEISSNASGQCWSMTSYCPVPEILENVPANNDYKPGFMAKMMLKDLCLAQLAAETVAANIPLGEHAVKLYTCFVNQGNGETDFSGIINFIKNKKTDA